MRFKKEELELRAQSVEKVQVEEEKLKASEEKFQKLKAEIEKQSKKCKLNAIFVCYFKNDTVFE